MRYFFAKSDDRACSEAVLVCFADGDSVSVELDLSVEAVFYHYHKTRLTDNLKFDKAFFGRQFSQA